MKKCLKAAPVLYMVIMSCAAQAQPFSLVKDINITSSESSYPGHITEVGGIAFFTAFTPTLGWELWKSDGTAGGTVLVKDIYPGSPGGVPLPWLPQWLTNVNGVLFFSANDGVNNGDELWKSDGTAAGTVMVKNIYPLTFSQNPLNFTNVNGVLFFSVDDYVNGGELWKSDGTAAGTVMLKHFGSDPENLTNVNGVLFFVADDGVNGQELWKSDGTAAGTVLVKDI